MIDARTALALYRMHYEEIETKFRCQEALEELQLNRRTEESKASEEQSFKDVQYLLEKKADLFNITPPNTKAEDKLKHSKYKLQPEESSKVYKGFKVSKVSKKSERISTAESSGGQIDPFSQEWIFASKKEEEEENKVQISKFEFY